MTRIAAQGGDEFGDLHGNGLRDLRERGRGKSVCILLVSLCALAGIGLGISMGLTKASIKEIIPPTDLSSTCSPGAVSTKRGYSTCESVCAQAECCRLPASHRKSCAEDQADACEVFDTFCAILAFDYDNDGKVEVQEKVTVPPADSSINEKCQWDNIASTDGFFACKNACSPGNCCLEEIETCRVMNPEMCTGYESCEVLRVQNVVTIPPALPNIADYCSPESLDDPEGYKMCKNACDPGECCLEPIEACKVNNPEMCQGFEVCTILHHSTPKSHPTSVKSQVDTKCHTNTLACDDDVQNCKDICEPAACCFTSDIAASCRNNEDADDWCSQYAACQILDHIDDDGIDNHEEALLVIQGACSDSSPDGLTHCSNVCAPAHCCFDGSQNCFDIGFDDLRCSHYDACGILYHNDKDPSTSVNPNPLKKDTSQKSMMLVAEQVADACETAYEDVPNEQQECLNLCEDNLCCFSDDPNINCMEEHGEMCVVYAACNSLLFGKYKPDLDSPEPLPNNLDHVEKSDEFYTELMQKCDENNIKDTNGLTDCFEMCQSHLCCFSHNMADNCYDDHPLECDDYVQCGNLIDPCDPEMDIPPVVPQLPSSPKLPLVSPVSGPTQEDIYAACALDTIKESSEAFEECHKMCADHLCCYSPGGIKSNCMYAEREDSCFKYNGCSNLLIGKDGQPVGTPSSESEMVSKNNDIAILCSDDFIHKNGSGDCETMCVEKQCCYLQDAGNCQVTDPEWCENIELCLNTYDIKENVEADKKMARCRQTWDEDCASLCDERACCLTRGIGSCAITDAKWCEIAQMCPVEDEQTPVPQLGLDDLASACEVESLKTIEGLGKCQDMCKAHLCCYSFDPNENCFDDHPRECDDYSPCNKLLSLPSSEPKDNSLPKSEIDELCMGSSIATESGLAACHSVCSNYLCCFSPVGTKSNCIDSVGEEMCYKYSACTNLMVTDGLETVHEKEAVNEVDHAIEDACSNEALMEYGGMSDCFELCEERKCCDENNGANCMVTTAGYCNGYNLCHGLDYMDEEDEVYDACSPNDSNGEEWISECREKCDPYQCCWASIEELNCSWQRPECLYYTEPCNILGGMLTGTEDIDEYEEPEVYDPADYKQAIEKQCSESSLQTAYGLELCREACTPHSCCFLDIDDCGSNPEEECEMFSACTNLHDFEGEVKEVQSAPNQILIELDVVCDIEHLNRFGSSACENHCDRRACCFTDTLSTNCYEEEKEWCEEFSACENMLGWTPPASSTPNDTSKTPLSFDEELASFCSPDAISKDNGQKCLSACEPNECCYIHGPRSCYEGHEQVCSDFLICNNLFGT